MTAAVGFPTLRLVRIAVGPITLGDLQPGDWRELDLEERRQLLTLKGECESSMIASWCSGLSVNPVESWRKTVSTGPFLTNIKGRRRTRIGDAGPESWVRFANTSLGGFVLEFGGFVLENLSTRVSPNAWRGDRVASRINWSTVTRSALGSKAKRNDRDRSSLPGDPRL